MYVLIGAALIIAIVLWQWLLKKQEEKSLSSGTGSLSANAAELKINFNVLKNPLLKELQPFPELKPLEESTTTVKGKIEITGEKGRKNPFLPY